uniref:C-type lectin domain-containing protein n=1 Tax=Denticeps clupeoides TaxID=299321 RepID=A0AAY4ERX0_9TELE
MPPVTAVQLISLLLQTSGTYSGKWETTNCFKNLGYICKMSGDSHCDEGYLLFGDHCYHFETEMTKNWNDAEAYCVNQNANLVSIHTAEQWHSAHMSRSSWVGLNDIQNENHFVWSDGSPTDFLPWEPNQPDNWQGDEDCVHMRGVEHYNPGTLNDLPCTSSFPFICQKGTLSIFISLSLSLAIVM